MMLHRRRRSSISGRRRTTGCIHDYFNRRAALSGPPAGGAESPALHEAFTMHQTGHPHTHEQHDHPGLFHERDAPLTRDYSARSFTVGIGGPVGSGKTALMLALCQTLRGSHSLGVVTNDIFTREDAEFLIRHKAL